MKKIIQKVYFVSICSVLFLVLWITVYHNLSPPFWSSDLFYNSRILESPNKNWRCVSLNSESYSWLNMNPDLTHFVQQLDFIPSEYTQTVKPGRIKQIVLYNNIDVWNTSEGSEIFYKLQCPIQTCTISFNRTDMDLADMVIYRNDFETSNISAVNPKQIKMMYYDTVPQFTKNVSQPDVFNWTASFRHDSDIVTPVMQWQFRKPKSKSQIMGKRRNIHKPKLIAWLPMSCDENVWSFNLLQSLKSHLDIDIYHNECGTHNITDDLDTTLLMIETNYYFLIVEEQYYCRGYIKNPLLYFALKHDIVPVVFGPPKADYKFIAAWHSFIHYGNFVSMLSLSEHLKEIAKSTHRYSAYFRNRAFGSFFDTLFWCRVCSKLHDEVCLGQDNHYVDINSWWHEKDVCST